MISVLTLTDDLVNNMKKAIVIFPPQWCPVNPYPSLPTLLGCLKKSKKDATGFDLNIRFYNYILSEEYLKKVIEKVYINDTRDGFPSYERALEILEHIEETKSTFRNSDLFYQPDKLFAAKADVSDALIIISEPYYPSSLKFSDYFHSVPINDFETLNRECTNRKTNIFYDFLESQIGQLANGTGDYFLISVTDITQLLSAFTLGRMLKESCSKPVCIGGNIITKLKKAFSQSNIIFNKYTDFLLTGPGEKSIVEFAEYMDNEIDVSGVSGLIYPGNKIIQTNRESYEGFSEPVLPDYSGLNMNEYFAPAPDCSLQLSRGCYWGKCAFCDVSFNRENYVPKPIDAAISEIEHLISLGFRHIHLGDSSVSPAYFDKLCDKILEKKLEIYIFAFARLEKAFTPELLNKMYRAGVRLIFWGYECESRRIMSLINKGIDLDSRFEILRYSAECGIWNHVSFMIGFPGETSDEAEMTLSSIEKNRDIVDSCFLAKFSYKTNAKINDNPEKYPVKDVSGKGILSTECFYSGEGMKREEVYRLSLDFRNRYIKENIDTLWPMLCDDLEHLLFYLSKFGREKVRSIRLSKTEHTLNVYDKFLM